MGLRTADIAAASSITTAAWVNLANINMLVQITAGIVAIIAGLAAAAFHIYRIRLLKKERQKKQA